MRFLQADADYFWRCRRSGASEVVAGTALEVTAGWTGVGAVGAVGLGALSGDRLQAGLRQSLSGKNTHTGLSREIQITTGVSAGTADLLDAGINIGASLEVGAIAKGASSTFDELSSAATRAADTIGSGRGSVYGTQVRSEWREKS